MKAFVTHESVSGAHFGGGGLREAVLAITLSLAIGTGGDVRGATPGEEAVPVRGYPGYEVLAIEGWRVLVSGELREKDPELAERTVGAVRKSLESAVRLVPPQRLRFLREVPIWVELEGEVSEGVVYHPSDKWLHDQGGNRDKKKAIEIADAARFLHKLGRQPMLLLHELAHAYHHQELGWEHEPVVAAFRSAKASGRYESVKRGNGPLVRAYAISNPREYFAELTEAYFGRNDYQPKTREELAEFDRAGFEAVHQAWNRP